MAAVMVTALVVLGRTAPADGPNSIAAAAAAERFGAPAVARDVPAPPVSFAVDSAFVTAPPSPETPDHLAPADPPAAPPTTVVVAPVDTTALTLADAPPEAPTDPAPEPPPVSTSPDPEPAPVPTSPDPEPAEPAPPSTTTAPPTTTTPPTTTAPPTTTTAAPAPSTGSVAAAFLGDINALRGSVGLGGLVRDGSLDAMAQSWADRMAADDWLRHSALIHDVIAQGWAAAGENIAYGPDEASMFAGLRASPGHHANMVNPAYTHVGIGVTVRNGVTWTAHLFAG